MTLQCSATSTFSKLFVIHCSFFWFPFVLFLPSAFLSPLSLSPLQEYLSLPGCWILEFLRGQLWALPSPLSKSFPSNHGFSSCLYIDDASLLSAKIISPLIVYLTLPYRCLRGISDSACLKWGSWSSSYTSVLHQSQKSRTYSASHY